MEYIKEYVDVHDPGNPQARMTSFVDGGSYDIGTIEGEIRQIFYSRAKKKGVEPNLTQIKTMCRAHLDGDKASAMAERVYNWLVEQGVRAWR